MVIKIQPNVAATMYHSHNEQSESTSEAPTCDSVLRDVSKYPHLEYSRHDVRRAGRRLAGTVLWGDNDEREEIYRTFAIASNWRDSHVYPMRSIRMSLIQRMKRMGVGGVTASRPKRMASIRRKLKLNKSMNLDQINDLGGCRVILDDIEGVWSVVKECTENFPHETRGKPYDYVNTSKSDGYRSYHLVFEFSSKDHALEFNGRRVELQIRTRLQHAWSTAVEAVGQFRNENFKGGEGNTDWRRLFKLMSDEFALAERCEGGLSERRSERIDEIRHLNNSLNAVGLLDDLRNVTRYFVEYVQTGDAKYYLIAYDDLTKRVTVTPYGDALVGSLAYDKAERDISWDEGPHNVVLVEIDKISSLVDAYPNYFGDVLLFSERLRSLCKPGSERFDINPQAVVARRATSEKPDMSWMNHPKWRRWTEKL